MVLLELALNVIKLVDFASLCMANVCMILIIQSSEVQCQIPHEYCYWCDELLWMIS